MKHEENPFEDKIVALEWINSVENDKGRSRDKDIYPRLQTWVRQVNPVVVLEIGCGQGICAEKLEHPATYVGVEPSGLLVARAEEKYTAPNRTFLIGSAYAVPLDNESVDAAFSVNVWFHLGNLEAAALELSRVLRSGASFFVVTANPDAYSTWENFYIDFVREGNKLVGKVNIPVNPLSRNTMYEHPLGDILKSLQKAGLEITNTEQFGEPTSLPGRKLFISIQGTKT